VSLCLTYFTGNPIFDAMGSIGIGSLLFIVSGVLLRKNMHSLTGKSIPADKLKELVDCLNADEVVVSVHNPRAIQIGAESISFKAEIEFNSFRIAEIINEHYPHILKAIHEAKSTSDQEVVTKLVQEYAAKAVERVGDEIDRLKLKLAGKNKQLKFIDLESN